MIQKSNDFMRQVSEWLALSGGVVLVGMALYTVVDVLGRKFLGQPLPGGVDVVSYGLGLAIASALPYCSAAGQHISVSMFTDMLPRRALALSYFLTSTVSAVFVGLLTYRIILHTISRYESGNVMWMLGFKVWPVWSVICALLVLKFVIVVLLATTALTNLVGRWQHLPQRSSI
ncbi:MAG: TRAP transporter small permease [Ectothiorhodospiraceae bacterium]|nr:TRAP transporter small permease [Ectothiorhodospiraceae bacterium]MCH8504891.1 TRAP transporter small permease [Ectothiorhodospiraceae bacterium]